MDTEGLGLWSVTRGYVDNLTETVTVQLGKKGIEETEELEITVGELEGESKVGLTSIDVRETPDIDIYKTLASINCTRSSR